MERRKPRFSSFYYKFNARQGSAFLFEEWLDVVYPVDCSVRGYAAWFEAFGILVISAFK